MVWKASENSPPSMRLWPQHARCRKAEGRRRTRMKTTVPRAAIAPGDPAPDFSLPAVNRDGTVSLADYRGRTSVLLALMRGLYCAFCRRHIAQLGTTYQKLKPLGVDTLAV